jgi:hypothetical protein
MTENMGQRLSVRSKEMAADLRRPRETGADETEDGSEAATEAMSEGEAERV